VGHAPAGSPRVPAQGSSAQGEPAPKARPKGVADGNQVNIPGPAGGDGTRTLSALTGLGGPPRVPRKQPPHQGPYPKPTQVDWSSIPRRSRERRRRNSANCPRNLGRSGPRAWATMPEGHRPGGGDCLLKTQGSAKSGRRRIGSDACPVPEGQGERCEPRTEAPVNGGRNYNGPKVAKFLVG
jgi:hypothetical protein